MGEGGGGEEKERKFLSFTSLPFSLPFFPFSPETPDTQARRLATGDTYRSKGLQFGIGRCTAMLLKADFCKAIAKRVPQFIKFPQTGWSHS